MSSNEIPTTEKIYSSGDQYFADILGSIDQAQTEIIVEFYIYAADELGSIFDEALIRAAQRKVQVRVLVDGIGSQEWIEKRHSALVRQGVLVRVYHPVFFTHFLDEKSSPSLAKSWAFLRKLNLAFSHLNRRNHRKIVLIDRKKLFAGSLNISEHHSQLIKKEEAWLDLGVEIGGGEDIATVLRAHERAWTLSRYDINSLKERVRIHLPILKKGFQIHQVVLNDTPHKRKWALKRFREQLRQSQEKIWIINPYIAPARGILRELKAAAKRGVDVRLLVSKKSDVFFMPWVAAAYYRPLSKSGVKIFEFPQRFVHAKSMIIDTTCVIGSSNLNQRSLLHDLELDVVLRKNENKFALNHLYQQIMSASLEIDQNQGRWKSYLGRLILFFVKYWI